MQVLVELIAGFIAMLVAAALASVGVDLTPREPTREVRRVDDREARPSPQKAVTIITAGHRSTLQDC